MFIVFFESSVKGDGLLSEVYYLQDYVRNLPFANERKLMDSSKQDESNNLLPRALISIKLLKIQVTTLLTIV